MSEKDDVWTLAQTIFGEARGEPLEGQWAVAAVVLNRARRSGKSMEFECRKPYQFSCWLPTDPNKPKLVAASLKDPVFRACFDVALAALTGRLKDYTQGATHYHAVGILPYWATGKTPCVQIGDHLFYNDID